LTRDYDQCLLGVSGEVIVKIFKVDASEEDLELYSLTLRKGDLLYLPRSTKYQLKSKKSKPAAPQTKGFTVVLALHTSQSEHTWRHFLATSLQVSLKTGPSIS
jgi:hypothetical protein